MTKRGSLSETTQEILRITRMAYVKNFTHPQCNTHNTNFWEKFYLTLNNQNQKLIESSNHSSHNTYSSSSAVSTNHVEQPVSFETPSSTKNNSPDLFQQDPQSFFDESKRDILSSPTDIYPELFNFDDNDNPASTIHDSEICLILETKKPRINF
jgi:hypothetical protein